jgi:hypothetical protein
MIAALPHPALVAARKRCGFYIMLFYRKMKTTITTIVLLL